MQDDFGRLDIEREEQERYFTPPHVVDFVLGSGAFLQSVMDVVMANPPFSDGELFMSSDHSPTGVM